MAGSIASGRATYTPKTYIITCIMPRPARPIRFKAVRRSSEKALSAASPANGRGLKPAPATARRMASRCVFAGSHSTHTREVATFTLTRATPGTAPSARSIERLHDAHRMPSAANTARARPVSVFDQNACALDVVAAVMVATRSTPVTASSAAPSREPRTV